MMKLFIWLPKIDVGSISYEFYEDAMVNMTQSIIWGITDWIQVIILIGWVPITMAIALRELVNASTFRVYLSCLIVSILIGLIIYFFRPSFLFKVIAGS